MSIQRDRIADLRARVARIVREATGLHEQYALPIAQSICEDLARDFGGSELYVPACNIAERNAAIRKDFHGNNHQAVMRKYRISRATLYRVIGI